MRDDAGNTPLHDAAYSNNNPEVITALIDAGASVGVRDDAGNTPLHDAAYSNKNPEVITALIDAGALVDARDDAGNTPLQRAVMQASKYDPENVILIWEKIYESIIRNLANVFVVERFEFREIRIPGDDGYEKRLRAIEILIEAGASVEAKNNDEITPLQYAKQHSNKDIITLLEKKNSECGALRLFIFCF